MALTIGSYSHDHFQSLPSLSVARDNFMASNGDNLVENCFQELFLNGGVAKTFGLVMLHRHFDLEVGQMLVDYNGTSTPWPTDKAMYESIPAIWGFPNKETIAPLEFTYSNESKSSFTEKQTKFIMDFKQLLEEKNLRSSFGLCMYPGDDFKGTCEITVNTSNINLKPEHYPKNLSQTTTAWFFSEELRMRGCRCTCDNRHDPHAHGAHVYTQSG